MSDGTEAAIGLNPLPWVRLGGWAIADQALFATSNFTLGILLARWLSPAEFGAFTIAQSAFLLMGVFHVALLAEPMLVFGTSRYADNFPIYLRQLVKGHWYITSAGTGLFLLAALLAWIHGSRALAAALLGAACATPAMLLVWLARRACFARLQPRYAATAGAAYFALMVAAIAGLYVLDMLAPFYAYVALGICSLFVGAVLIRVLQKSTGSGVPLHARRIAREHWRYARWALASSTISWFTGNIYFFVLPVFGGLASTGAFRAVSNLALPMFQVIAALSTLLLPMLARSRGTPKFRSVLVVALMLFVGSAALYWVIIASVAKPAMNLLYAGHYSEYAQLLWLIGILPVIAGVVAVVSNALRACERPDLVFWAYTVAALVTSSFGLWAVLHWQIAGAVAGQILANSATAVVLLELSRRKWMASLSPSRDVVQKPGSQPGFGQLVGGRPA